MTDLTILDTRVQQPGCIAVGGVPQGLDAMLLPHLARTTAPRPILHICLDDQRLATLAEQLAFFDPEVEVLRFPAWDTLPYDRVSPTADVISRRLATLAALALGNNKPTVVLTTVNAILQRVIPKSEVARSSFSFTSGKGGG